MTGQRKVKPDGNLQEPYSEVMDAEITRLQNQITESITRRDEENDKWVSMRPSSILASSILEKFSGRPFSHILTLYTGSCERQGYRSRRGWGLPHMALDRLRRRDG